MQSMVHHSKTPFFTFDLGIMVTKNVAEYPSQHVTHVPGKFEVAKEMHLKEITFFDLDLGIKVTLNIAQHPLHHVTYSPESFKLQYPTV